MMSKKNAEWNPRSPEAWADALGLVHVPLFGRGVASHAQKGHSVLLDGHKSSFLLLSDEDPEVKTASVQWWAWSSNVNLAAVLHADAGTIELRSWSSRTPLAVYKQPPSERGAIEFLKRLQDSPAPDGPSVIAFVLRAFRLIRTAVGGSDSLDAVRTLNALLVGTARVRQGVISDADWRASGTVGEAVNQIPAADQRMAEVHLLSPKTRDVQIGTIAAMFLRPDPVTGCYLDPSLLLRHAAGQLYQEAHLQLEREPDKVLFPAFADTNAPRGKSRPDVRFTPTNLARALVDQAIQLRSTNPADDLNALDPACGSGVFLQEVLRAAEHLDFSGHLQLRGFDTSAISCAMANFALKHMLSEATPAFRGRCVVSVIEQDALETDWGSPQLILMNPPFAGWREMNEGERAAVASALEHVYPSGKNQTDDRGRPDKAMAFIYKAAISLRAGSVLASVLPAPLLETASGERWRSALLKQRALRLVGRFQDFGIFAGAVVEPAVIILEQLREGVDINEGGRPVTVLYSHEQQKDTVVRSLRLGGTLTVPNEAEVYDAPQSLFTSANWTPQRQSDAAVIEQLSALSFPRVGDLFDVSQGAITGNNGIFVLTSEEIAAFKMSSSERSLFRPIASNSTIREGRIEDTEYIWYPYDSSGVLIRDIESLARLAPKYSEVLQASRNQLLERARVKEDSWWLLSEHRAWQRASKPKIVSTYFGRSGAFAYDANGLHVVMQGYGWHWKRGDLLELPPETGDGEAGDANTEENVRTPFDRSLLPWAYLAILNSKVFQSFVKLSCPRVRGGQYNLSDRFVTKVFLPDLSSDSYATLDATAELALVGRQIHSKSKIDFERAERATARLYPMIPAK